MNSKKLVVGNEVKYKDQYKDQYGIITSKIKYFNHDPSLPEYTRYCEILTKGEKIKVQEDEITLLHPFYRGQKVEVFAPVLEKWDTAEYVAYDHIEKIHTVRIYSSSLSLCTKYCRPYQEPKITIDSSDDLPEGWAPLKLEEKHPQLKPLKQSIKHWKRMIKWIKEQSRLPLPSVIDLCDTPDIGIMNNFLGETWTADDCTLCRHNYGICGNCILPEKYVSCGDCKSLWQKVNNSKTWKEWLKYAKLFLKELKRIKKEIEQ